MMIDNVIRAEVLTKEYLMQVAEWIYKLDKATRCVLGSIECFEGTNALNNKKISFSRVGKL